MLFGPLLSPLALAIRRSLPAIARALGYHAVSLRDTRVRNGDVKRIFGSIQQERSRMATGLHRTGRAPEFDEALPSTFFEIQFCDGRAIPQADPRFGAGSVRDDGIWINRRNIGIGAQIDGLQNSAGGNVEENDIVGQ